jgi:Tol biopolymer transport system component
MSSKHANHVAVDAIRGRLILAAVSLAGLALPAGAATRAAAVEAPPNGQIATVVGGGLVVIDASNGTRRELTTGLMSAASWSPDGRELAYVAGDDYGGGASLRATQVMSGRQRTIAPLGGALTVGPSWSPRGDQLALAVSLAVSPAETPMLLVIGRDGRRHVVARGVSAFQVPQWEANGHRLAYLTDSARRSAIWIVQPSSRPQRLLTRAVLSNSDTSLSWSPDGKQLAFITMSARQSGGAALSIVTVDAGAAQPRAVAAVTGTSNAALAGNVSWSPRGGQIAFIRWSPDPRRGRASAELCIADLGRRHVNAVVRAPHINELAWSNDGRWLAYITEDPGPQSPRSRVWLVRPDGSGAHKLASFSELTDGLTWRPPERPPRAASTKR